MCDIQSISLIYLVSGHSHSENDNAHSVIEQKWPETRHLYASRNPEKIFFKYRYDEGYRKAVCSAPRRELRKREIASRRAGMFKYANPPGVSLQKKEDLKKLCSKGLIPQRHHSFFDRLSVSK